MINADEHKKLLAQIEELEKNSVNYFDVEKEFFLITSDNLSDVQTRLYGYSIQRSGIYEDDNLTPEAIAGLDGRGCYVYVEVKEGKITIKQDLNGSWGIYLFRHGDYFALSNSFFRLLDHLKFRYPLTVNRDYCHQYLINDVCSHAYLETAVNEIQLADRNAVFHIEPVNKNLRIELIDYKEHTVPLDSEEGMAILDRWVEFWSNVFRGVAQNTKFLQIALSGGFDTRISLVILLNSGIDLNKIRIHSATDGLHTHAEDYEIASKIAEHYGFKLNQPLPVRQFLSYSLSDIWNIETYSQITFHNLPNIKSTKKNIDKVYSIGGDGGELIRGNWLRFGSLENFTNLRMKVTKNYSQRLSDELAISMKNSLNSAYQSLSDKYNNENSDYIPQYLYHDVRARNHFGKENLIAYLKGSFSLQPVFDPAVQTVQFDTPECPDYQLLMALVFTRYAPDLLNFPFQGKRSIAPETIEYAKKINERFPRRVKSYGSDMGGGYFHLQPRDLQAEKILSSERNNPDIPADLPQACLKSVFESSRTFGLFTAYFDAELYHYAASWYDTRVFDRSRHLYAVVGVTRVLEDVEISQRNHPPYRDMKRFLEQDFCRIDSDKQLIHKLSPYITAIILMKMMEGNFETFSVSDDKAKVTSPEWFQDDGNGYIISSYTGKLEIVAKSDTTGKFWLSLRGMTVPDPKNNSELIPYWIDYTKLTVNGKIMFNTITPACRSKSKAYLMDVKAGEEIKLQVEWLPHRSDT